jgi:hypothetical protein
MDSYYVEAAARHMERPIREVMDQDIEHLRKSITFVEAFARSPRHDEELRALHEELAKSYQIRAEFYRATEER